MTINVNNEFIKNKERYEILKWAQKSLKNFTLFPPGSESVIRLILNIFQMW